MSAELWTVEQLEAKLESLRKSGAVMQWSLKRERVDREEKYFIRYPAAVIAVDQARVVSENLYFVRIETSKGEKLGSAQLQFFTAAELETQIAALLAAAKLGEEDQWSYEKRPAVASLSLNRADPLVYENVRLSADRMAETLVAAVKANAERAAFNSAELFVARKQSELRLSNGFRGSETSAQIYSEVCFSATDRETGLSEEFLVTRSNARADQFDFPGMCAESAEFAAKSLRTERPRPGKYPVLIASSSLCPLFNDALRHLEAASKYYGTPFIEKGAEFIPGFSGEPFRVWLDPEMNHAFGSHGYDEYGEPQKRLLLVEDNRVVNHATSKKIADFLSVPKTTSCGAVVVEPQRALSEQALRRAEPQVLEILQFSALFSNPADLTFSSEIRLARLHDTENGTVTYIKGGSISGNFKESFARARWSDKKKLENVAEMTGAQSYYGPSFALLMDVNVTA